MWSEGKNFSYDWVKPSFLGIIIVSDRMKFSFKYCCVNNQALSLEKRFLHMGTSTLIPGLASLQSKEADKCAWELTVNEYWGMNAEVELHMQMR